MNDWQGGACLVNQRLQLFPVGLREVEPKVEDQEVPPLAHLGNLLQHLQFDT